MPPETKETKESQAQAAARKLADKYDSPEDLEKAYKELEAKLGEQGQKLGDLSKQAEQAEQIRQQYEQLAHWAQQAAPAIQWMQQHQQELSDWWTKRQTGQQPSQSSSYDQSQGLLTADEKRQLIEEAQRATVEQYLKPWQQQLDQRLNELANSKQKEVTDYVTNQQRANASLWWDALQNSLPKEQVERLQARHQKAMEFAEPNKINPLQLADQLMTYEEKVKQYEQQLEEQRKALEAERQRAAGLLNGSTSALDAFAKPEHAPATKKDRYSSVMNDVLEKHGAGGLESLFHKG